MAEHRYEELESLLAQAPAGRHWKGIGVRPRRGVCTPLSALRSERDCGVGDVADLESLVDWCEQVGLNVIQLLPVNDMGLDCVPYSALSAFALDPVFIALDRVDEIRDDPMLSVRIRDLAKRTNEMVRIPFQQVRREKLDVLAEAFRRAYRPSLRSALERFEAANSWLAEYLPYRVLKEEHDFRSWEDWGQHYPDRDSVRSFLTTHDGRRTFHLYLQWLLANQFRQARAYAQSKGVLLKGDIPILVSRDSADVWQHPDLFFLDTDAGAPPDMYAADGQVWGFPTYNWEALAETDYRWWRERLAYAQNFFDLYRIDHVVGFFRIWTVRHGMNHGRDGWFVPRNEDYWGEHGRKLLTMMLDASQMLPLAEDLGTIPDVTREVMAELGICGLKVQRWEKLWHEGARIISPADYQPLSVATVSTHDSETLAGWWKACPEERQPLWEAIGRSGQCPDNLEPGLHRAILRWVAQGKALFTIYMLQEYLQPFGLLPGEPEEHRINIPGTVADTNWTWRCPVTLEKMLSDENLCMGVESIFK